MCARIRQSQTAQFSFVFKGRFCGDAKAVFGKFELIADGLCVTPRWGFPEDIGKAVASLARRDFPYSTGATIYIDGGLHIMG